MIRIYTGDSDSNEESSGDGFDFHLVLPSYSYASLDYSKLPEYLLSKANSLGLVPTWNPGCFGGGVLTLSACTYGFQDFNRLVKAARLGVCINQMRGTEAGNESGLEMRQRVWKIGTELDSFCEQTGKYAVRFASALVSVENDNRYPVGVYSLLFSSGLKAISTDVKEQLIIALEVFGHRIRAHTVSSPAELSSWSKHINGRSQYSVSWTVQDPLDAAKCLAECWYVAEHLDLTLQPLEDFALIGRFHPEINFIFPIDLFPTKV